MRAARRHPEGLWLALLLLGHPLLSGGAEEGEVRKRTRAPSLGHDPDPLGHDGLDGSQIHHNQDQSYHQDSPDPFDASMESQQQDHDPLDQRNNPVKPSVPPGFLSPSVKQYLELGKSIPGRPGTDYPVLGTVPYTEFYCDEQEYPGFFADEDTRCQVWHYCDIDGRQASFLCPNGTQFSQAFFVCDWWFNVKCSLSKELYPINARLYGTPRLNPTRPHRLLTKQILENIFLRR